MDENRINARQTLAAQLIAKAMQDAPFRPELLRDPKGVFERELGFSIPANVTVQVVEKSPTEVYLVLPQRATGPGAELSDAELEGVAGGWSEGDTNCKVDV